MIARPTAVLGGLTVARCREHDNVAALARVAFVRRASATFAATRTLDARRIAPLRRPPVAS